jgi:hypothetical protein
MPDFDVNGPQPVQPGGGIEVCTTGQLFVFGCSNFVNGDWEDP